jgi:DNA primase
LANTFIDFNLVKQRVSMEAVLDHYNIRLRRVNQNSLRGLCPLPTHTSEKSKESFGIHVSKKIWSCQSSSCAAARSGKKGGNVLDFVAVMESCSIRDAATKLASWFSITANRTTTSEKTKLVAAEKTESGEEREENKPLTFALTNVDPTHEYLRARGIDEDTAQDFGVGFFPGRGTMSGRVVIPIHNKKGELVAYAGRAIDDTEPKYKIPNGFRKSIELFNLHRVGESERIVVVEGFFDCIKVHQSGFPCVALMGSSLSTEQEKILVQNFRRILFLFDGDDAGRRGADECLLRLGKKLLVMAVMLPEGKQPDSMSVEEMKSALRSF